MGKCIDTTEGSASVEEDKIFVAVGNVVNESFSTLLWALKSFRRKNFCIVHVHQPAQKIRVMGVKFRAELLDAEQVKAHREIEKKKVQDILNEYVDVCFHAGIDAETIYIEMDNIERGIVELIAQYGITKLVMGAAANKHYPKKMEELRSKKAIFVCQNAPISCHIWFVCKEHLIITREGVSEKIARQATTTPPSPLDTPTSLTSQPVRSRDRSEEKSLSHDGGPRNLVKGLFQPLRSTGNNSTGTSQPPCVFTQLSEDLRSEVLAKPQKRIDRLTNPVLDLVLRTISGSRETSEESTGASSSSSGGTAGIPIARCHSQNPDHSPRLSISSSEPFGESVENINDPSPTNDELAVVEPEIVRKEKKGREEKHDKERQELENLKSQLDQVMEELRIAQDQKVKLESQIADPDGMGTEFIQKKVLLAAEKLVAIKKELDDELRKLGKMKEEDFASLQRSQFFSVFSASEIESATQSFNPEMKLGEGGFGTVYKGHIRQTTVAVKRFNSNTLEGQSSSDFQLEVEVLSKVRHPNLVTLIGACPEASSLVFEYLSNGSLKDRLSCKEGTPPLSWKTRMRIAKEICSALIFLHSNKPLSIVHGDLKPANILLDTNFVTKLGDFGIASLIARDENSTSTTIICCTTNPKGTFAYIDPEFLVTGVLTPKADVYSFGVVLLQLLTGRPALDLPKQVQFALDQGTLNTTLDASAGDWPLVQAKQLAQMALRCCEFYRENRPNLELEVLKLLQLLEIEI